VADVNDDEEVILDALDMLLASGYAVQAIFKPSAQSASSTSSEPFSWQQLDAIVAELSKQSTNVALVFDGNMRPKGKDAVALCEKLQTPLVAFAHFLHKSLPTAKHIVGKAGAEQVREFASRLSDSVVKFIVAVKSPDNRGRLRQTGVVWEHCDAVGQLPRDAPSSAAVVIDRQVGMIEDVIEELQSTADSSDDEKQSAIVAAVLGLVKCVLAVLSKLKSTLKERGGSQENSADSVAAVDELTDQMELLSSTVDDLVVEVYGVQEQLSEGVDTVDAASLNSSADLLTSRLSHLLTSFAAGVFYDSAADQKRVDFLTKAIEHNRGKLQRAVDDIPT